MMHPATSTQDHRFHVLDALRGIAAILVVLHHVPQSLWSRHTPALYLAVDFFFCLSGFVVAFSYERRLADGRMAFREFVAVRLVRLYPLYWFGLTAGITLAIVGQHEDLLHLKSLLALQFAMVPNYFQTVNFPSVGAIYPFDIPAWSLYFEVVVNLAYGLMVRLGLAKSWMLAAIALLCAARLLFLTQHGWSVEQGWGSQPWHFPMGMCRVGLSFPLGVLTLRFYRRFSGVRVTGVQGTALALLATVILATILFSPGAFLHREPVRLAAVTMLFPLIVGFAALIRMPDFWARPCSFLGDVSYPLYLLHAAILYWELQIALPWSQAHPHRSGFVLAAMLSVMILVSYAVLTLYDKPVRRALRSALRHSADRLGFVLPARSTRSAYIS